MERKNIIINNSELDNEMYLPEGLFDKERAINAINRGITLDSANNFATVGDILDKLYIENQLKELAREKVARANNMDNKGYEELTQATQAVMPFVNSMSLGNSYPAKFAAKAMGNYGAEALNGNSYGVLPLLVDAASVSAAYNIPNRLDGQIRTTVGNNPLFAKVAKTVLGGAAGLTTGYAGDKLLKTTNSESIFSKLTKEFIKDVDSKKKTAIEENNEY